MKITAGILFYWISRDKETQHIRHSADGMELLRAETYRGQKEAEPGVLYLQQEKKNLFLFCCRKKSAVSEEILRGLKTPSTRRAESDGFSSFYVRTKEKKEFPVEWIMREWNLLLEQNNELLGKIASQESVEEIMAEAEKLLRCPIVLVDRNMALLYETRGLVQKMTALFGEGYAADITEELMLSKEFHEVATKKKPFYYYLKTPEQYNYCHNIFVDGNYYARLVILIEKGETSLSSGAEQLADYLAEVILKLIQNGTLRLYHEGNDRLHVFCRQVAEGARPEVTELKRALSRYGSMDSQQYQVFCLEPFYAEGWETQMETTLPLMTRRLEQTWPSSCAVATGEQILWLVIHERKNIPVQQYSFFQELLILLRENVFRAGASSIFTDISLLRDAYKQAEAALWIGAGKDESYWFFRFDDYRLDYMVDQLQNKDIHKSLLSHPAIGILKEYDATHDSQLTETLKVFAEKGQNVTQAADALFVHRTTLFRRLQQIKELTGIHLEDQKEMLALQLSFYFLQEQ